MPIYVCVDNRDIIDVNPDHEIPGQSDLAINGHSYRRLDPVFFAWIDLKIRTALKAPGFDEEQQGDLIGFHERLAAIVATHEPLATVPAGYAKPDIAEQTEWLKEIVW